LDQHYFINCELTASRYNSFLIPPFLQVWDVIEYFVVPIGMLKVFPEVTLTLFAAMRILNQYVLFYS